ncbi:MAG: response regulator [Thermodesulfobacteriota bacterium]
MKILIVEDDRIARKVITKYLVKYGKIEVADNGLEALTAFETARQGGEGYDLVCLDIMMPKMNGHETLAAMRQSERAANIAPDKRCTIIMTTALDDSQNILKSFDNDCNGYITKPYSFDKFQTELERILNSPTH